MKGNINPALRPRASQHVRIGSNTVRIILGVFLLFCLPSAASNTSVRADTSSGTPMSELRVGMHSHKFAENAPPPPPPVSADAKTKDAVVPPLPADAPAKQSDAKVKDAWDKAQIISGFLATVVLAGVALLINAGIQRAQIRASADNTKAQIEVAKGNNDAQLALTKQNAEVQRQLQQSTLTGQLVEHLAGGSALKKQIAIVALRRSVPSEMYQEIITIVVRSETDPEVRKTALGQAATLSSAEPSVVQAITEAAKDITRSGEERKIATNTVQQLGLRSITPGDTFVFSSSSGSQVSSESDELQAGVFTHYLVRGLSGDASFDENGSVRISELGRYVTKSVMEFTRGRQAPYYAVSSTEGDLVILGPGGEFAKTVVVAVGNSNYREPITRLQYGASDANRFAAVFRQHGAVVYEVEDATRSSFLKAIDSATRETDDHSLLIFYYSGHAIVDSDGVFWLLPVDTITDMLTVTAISTAELKNTLFQASARAKVLFLDAAFSGSLMGHL